MKLTALKDFAWSFTSGPSRGCVRRYKVGADYGIDSEKELKKMEEHGFAKRVHLVEQKSVKDPLEDKQVKVESENKKLKVQSSDKAAYDSQGVKTKKKISFKKKTKGKGEE